MPRTTTFDLIERALDGHAAELLKALRDEGLSWEEVAHRFRDKGLNYSSETWRRWAGTLGIAA